MCSPHPMPFCWTSPKILLKTFRSKMPNFFSSLVAWVQVSIVHYEWWRFHVNSHTNKIQKQFVSRLCHNRKKFHTSNKPGKYACYLLIRINLSYKANLPISHPGSNSAIKLYNLFILIGCRSLRQHKSWTFSYTWKRRDRRQTQSRKAKIIWNKHAQ